MENYCIYLRKSRADVDAEMRGEGETLARHEAVLIELAKKRKLTITQIYREIVSGETIAARPAIQNLLRDVEHGIWHGVLVMDIDRLARGDTLDQGIVAQAFRFSSTSIITPMKTYDPNNEFDEEYFEFGLFMSRREYKTINRRLQRGRLASLREGKYVGSGQPYGYKKIKLEREKGFTLEPLDEQSAIVRNIYDWYVNGCDGIRIGVSAISTKLNAMNITPVKGRYWSPSTVRDMLTNPVYTGKLRWNWRPVETRIEAGRKVSCRPRKTEYEVVDGIHSPIVNEEIWNRAQALMRENSVPKTSARRQVKNPLSGLIVCGICGNRLVRKPYKNSSPDSLLCITPGCKNVSSYLHVVEFQLMETLNDWLERYKVSIYKHAPSDAAPKAALLKQLKDELSAMEKQKLKAHELLEREIYSVNTFLERSGEINQKIELISAEASKLEKELSLIAARESRRDKLIPDISYVLINYNSAETPAEKNKLLKEILEKAAYLKESGSRWQAGTFTLHLYPKVKM